ncbi:hypothetical protein N9B82_00640 [Saprospiraceae bacterium]|nr:hypothetical protein [Saprospiraceae bacterium]
MEHNYTENDIIQFIYRDMEAVDYCELLFSIDENPELKSSYEKMIGAKNDLPELSLSPSSDSVHMIMAYSQL